MLSVVLSATTITMNRGEQENLFRQSRNLRLQQEEKQQQKLVLHQHHQQQQQQQQQHQQYISKPRHYSYGNIHQVSNLHMQASNSRSFGDDRGSGGHQFGGVACDDLVLSVLKSPVKETTNLLGSSSIGGQTISASPSAGSNGLGTGVNTGTGTATTQSPSPCAGYQALRGSDDDLLDDIESAIETTELNAANAAAEPPSSSPRGLKFLRRFRTGKTGRFEPHHRRVPTPIRRKNRSRSRSRSNADILDGVTTGDDPCDVLPGDDDPCDVDGTEDGVIAQKIGVPDPYYPIALPIDQAFKAKYVFHHRRGKTVQERFYVFLEHPVGWLCFVYHFSVKLRHQSDQQILPHAYQQQQQSMPHMTPLGHTDCLPALGHTDCLPGTPGKIMHTYAPSSTAPGYDSTSTNRKACEVPFHEHGKLPATAPVRPDAGGTGLAESNPCT